MKISALIPTFNEAHNIEAAIASVAWADEIIVVDSFSTDQTVEIAKPLVHRILQREYENSASQKNWAIPQAEHEWVFILDADERVSPELREEILALCQQQDIPYDAFRIRRQNFFMGQAVNYSGWQQDSVIRLFRRDCRYETKHVHAEVITHNKQVKTLRTKLIHNTYKNLNHYFQKIDQYTLWNAQEYLKKGKKVGVLQLFFKPIGRFFLMYGLRLGFLDGRVGLIIALLSSYVVFLRYLKAWRLLEGENWQE
jgi:glycosyltransferase involved in cell wall biosynthesis